MKQLSKEAQKEQQVLGGRGSVEDMQKSIRMFARLAEALTNPVIAHPMWMDTVTDEQKMRITVERMKQIKDSEDGRIQEASDYEALVYLMTASLTAPLDRVHYNLYAYLFNKQHPDKAESIFPEHERVRELDYMEKDALIRLKRWIYKKSKEARK